LLTDYLGGRQPSAASRLGNDSETARSGGIRVCKPLRVSVCRYRQRGQLHLSRANSGGRTSDVRLR